MKTTIDDSLLWQSFKEGSGQSFNTIYSSNFNNLYAYGLRIVPDNELVKDSIHDLFVKLWKNKSNLAEVKAIKPYLIVSLRSILYNKIEQTNRSGILSIPEPENCHFEMTFSVESDYIRKEDGYQQTRLLINALNQLTERQKEAIYLRYFEELDYDEIASIMGITVKATYKLASRGLAILREYLGTSSYALGIWLLLLRSHSLR
jgi:RNA polymerase sigma factor (sigma-70 family)